MATIDPITGLPSSNTQTVYPGDKPINPPTVPTPVGTTVTKVQTPVISSTTATNHINDVIVPTMNQAQTSIQTQQEKKSAGMPIYSYKNDNPAQEATITGYRQPDGSIVPVNPTKTPEQEIADTADAGYKFAYGADGSRTQIPISESPSLYGMSDTNPTVAPTKPVLSTAELPSGTSVKQYNDGTYGLYDVSGKYIGAATANQFKNAQNGQDVLDKLNQAVSGNYPLTPNQQAQIDNIKLQYQGLISQQEKANANYTGGTTVAQNLYGIGNTMLAQNQIKSVIDEGVSKINDIQSKMNSDVAKMTAAFQSNNLEDLKAAYNAYSVNNKALQDNIDKIHDDTASIVAQEKQNRVSAELAIDNDIRGLIDTATKANAPADILAKIQDALLDHDFARAAKEGGEYLIGGTGIVGEYYATKRDFEERNPGREFMSLDDYSTKDANRKAAIARAGAAIASGTDMTTKQAAVFNHIVDTQNKNPTFIAAQRSKALETIAKAVEKDPGNAQLQLALIYGTIQILDSYNSAVREGEINLVQGTQGLKDKISNIPSKIEKGNPLNPKVALEYAKLSKLMVKSINDGAAFQNNRFRSQAVSNGIGKQFDEYNATAEELNKTSIADEHAAETANDPLGVGGGNNKSNNNPLGI